MNRRLIFFISSLVIFVLTSSLFFVNQYIQPLLPSNLSSPLFLVSGIILGVVTFLAGFKDTYELIEKFVKRTDSSSAHISNPPNERHRKAALRNLEHVWIKGFLEPSLHNIVRVELVMVYAPHAVTRTWEYTLQQPKKQPQVIPIGTPIIKVFQQSGNCLIVLGEPGSGKTITLLELARDLRSKALRDNTQPIPFFLNLSSWGKTDKDLVEWLVKEIYVQYQVAYGASRTWLAENQIALLLDGLDEIPQQYRDSCVTAINEFRKKYMADLAVASRSADYTELTEKLNLSTAIIIQPLSPLQVDRFLEKVGQNATNLRQAVKYDKDLQELLSSPLMLCIATLAYNNRSTDAIKNLSSNKDGHNQIIANYIDYSLKRHLVGRKYTPEQAVYWLSNFARAQYRWSNTLTIHYANYERLMTRNTFRSFWLVSTPFYSLCKGIILGLIGGLVLSNRAGFQAGLQFGFFVGVTAAIVDFILSYGWDREPYNPDHATKLNDMPGVLSKPTNLSEKLWLW